MKKAPQIARGLMGNGYASFPKTKGHVSFINSGGDQMNGKNHWNKICVFLDLNCPLKVEQNKNRVEFRVTSKKVKPSKGGKAFESLCVHLAQIVKETVTTFYTKTLILSIAYLK